MVAVGGVGGVGGVGQVISSKHAISKEYGYHTSQWPDHVSRRGRFEESGPTKGVLVNLAYANTPATAYWTSAR